ncbi:hypothetical protein DUI87_07482 [Hirundo rustica rustica]|uniref:Rna-directed dna polymerase from mobile element jockey-like n=1 Tax=Hirundo rustica rustica TaxID=333673 RepID=A0A3M0KQB2_HIRRU|nr:hypothetical protein DUI87_07482 [Hirundo rustica rustica]
MEEAIKSLIVLGNTAKIGAIQRDLDEFEKLAHGSFMKFNKTKCKVLHVGRDNSWSQYRSRAVLLRRTWSLQESGRGDVGEDEARKPYKYGCLDSENVKPVNEIELKDNRHVQNPNFYTASILLHFLETLMTDKMYLSTVVNHNEYFPFPNEI